MALSDPNGDLKLAEATGALLAFLDGVDATLDTHTQMMRMARVGTTSAQAFQEWLRSFTDPGDHWSFTTMSFNDGSRRASATPTTDIGPETHQLYAFTQVPQLMWSGGSPLPGAQGSSSKPP